MTRSHRKKTRKYRGKRTFGTGKIGTRRAKGQRGGTGLTTGKQKYHYSKYIKIKQAGFPGYEGDKWRIGKHGFKRPPNIIKANLVEPINIKDIEYKIEEWLEKEKITEDGGKYIIDLTALGYDKLLGKGKATKNMEITVKTASAGAKKKLEQANCVLNLAE